MARHQDYYLALANEDRDEWQRIEGVYGQIKWAWQAIRQEEARLDWVKALRTYQGRRGLWRDQLAWYEAGLEAARSQELRQDEGTMLNNIGLVYNNLGQREKALAYYQQALLITEEVGDRAGERNTRYNRAHIYRTQGRLDEAVTQLRRVVELDRMVRHPNLESDLALLAQVLSRLIVSLVIVA